METKGGKAGNGYGCADEGGRGKKDWEMYSTAQRCRKGLKKVKMNVAV